MAAPVREGEILAGKYRVDRVLGIGGMGVVVAAHHIHLDEKVAIKFLLPETLGNQQAVDRFAREARAAVRIKSEHVARITDVGVLENGSPYMVMEYLQGGDLSAWLEQRGPLPIEQAVDFIVQACEAVAEAHALGIVHRDLKPPNLFVIRRPDGLFSIKVLDFGISKVSDASPTGPGGMTATNTIMGSPFYMSPEQLASSKNVDARTDIWALGVVLYELLTGVVPFSGETMPELVLQIVNASTPRVRDCRPEVPAALDMVVSRCLEKDRARRFGNVAEFATALAEFGSKRTRVAADSVRRIVSGAAIALDETALPPSSDSTPRSAPIATLATWGQTAGRHVGTRRGTVAAIVTGAALLGGVGVAMRLNATGSTGSGTGDTLPEPPPPTQSNAGTPPATAHTISPPNGGPDMPVESVATSANPPPAKADATSASPAATLPVYSRTRRPGSKPTVTRSSIHSASPNTTPKPSRDLSDGEVSKRSGTAPKPTAISSESVFDERE